MQTLGSCEDPATENTPLCGLIGEALSMNYTGNDSSDSSLASSTDSNVDQLSYTYNPLDLQENWQNYLVQSALTSVSLFC